MMKKVAKQGSDGVKKKKKRRRGVHQKVVPAIEEPTDDIVNAGGHATDASLIYDTQAYMYIDPKKTSNGLLPPLLPPLGSAPRKGNEFELKDKQNGIINTKHGDTQEIASNNHLPVVPVSQDNAHTPPRTPSPTAKRRRNGNMTSYERMLQRQNQKSRKKKTSLFGSYTMLQSGAEEERNTHDDDETETELDRAKPANQDSNQALLQYFAKLSSSPNIDDSLDLEHIKSLLQDGASVNTSDRFGQTLLHEVSRIWGVDVAEFCIACGADVNKADDYGRTPLHVAAAADYPEMVRFLLDKGADVHATTAGENQTPLHFAAKNEAVQSVRILLVYGADVDARDYKLRTPLQVAAEHSSAEATRALLDEGASAGVKDDSGMSALALLISKMPVVAYRVLDQFHSVDRTHRKQNFYLNFLENCDTSKDGNTLAPSPLQVASSSNCLELVMHPIFQRLIDVKWRYYRVEAWLDILPNVLLAILYTTAACTRPRDVKLTYSPLSTTWWRIVIEIIFALLTFNEIRKEVKEYFRSKRQSGKLIKWRKKEVARDFAFCHPRWPQERTFVDQEVRRTKGNSPAYFKDAWNYLDWITYIMLISVIILHFINVWIKSNAYNGVFIRIVACSMIFVWVRLLKYARPFPSQGPFVVMLDHIIVDTSKWLLLILMFYIPYTAAFWMMFGRESDNPIEGYSDFTSLIYTIIRIPLLDDYNFAELDRVAPYMSRVLCGSFIIIGAIVLMNLYIALLSNTFQRVYDNARATAAMQRARLLQDLESDASVKKLEKYRDFIRNNYSPEETEYIVVISDEEEQHRKQEEKVSEIHNIVCKRFGGKTFGKVNRSEFDTLLEDLETLKRSHGEMQRSLALITSKLEEITESSSKSAEERIRASHQQYYEQQEKLLNRFNYTVERIEAVYDIDNGLNPGQLMRKHKASQTKATDCSAEGEGLGPSNPSLPSPEPNE